MVVWIDYSQKAIYMQSTIDINSRNMQDTEIVIVCHGTPTVEIYNDSVHVSKLSTFPTIHRIVHRQRISLLQCQFIHELIAVILTNYNILSLYIQHVLTNHYYVFMAGIC